MLRFRTHPLIFALTLLVGLNLAGASKRTELNEARIRLQRVAQSAGIPFPFLNPELRIGKSAHRLELWASGKKLKEYPVGLGHRGLADKVRSGDHLTPEGHFFICNKNEQSQFHLFLGISYPNESAATRGMKAGLITKIERDQILRSLRNKSCPSWNTKLGGTVGIHGGGSNSDWTWGCIALENPDIEELWVACGIGTPVIIEP